MGPKWTGYYLTAPSHPLNRPSGTYFKTASPHMNKVKPLTAADYAAILRRRWLRVLIPAVLGPAIGYGLSRVLPPRYVSQSLLLVESQRVPDTIVPPVITEDLNARVSNIQEQVLSRTRLQPIIERLKLFRSEVASKTMDDLVAELQKDITVTPLKPIARSREDIVPGFSIEVTLDHASAAQQVCAEISSMFVDENIHQREESAQGTTSFLTSQLADAKQKLDEQDARLAAFQRKYMGMLPDETKTNLDVLVTLNTQLQAATQNLSRALENKKYAESVLAQQEQAWQITRDMQEGLNPAQDSNTLQKQLEELQARLTALRVNHTSAYPDVINVRAEIADVQRQIREAANVPPAAPKKPAAQASTGAAPEPLEIQKLQAQTHAYDEAIKDGTLEQQQLKKGIAEYESRLQLSPAIEEEYKKITRDHETALKFYNNLLGKQSESEMAGDLERRQEGEQFRVMDPANLPDSPSFPNRPLFAFGGLGLGLALGVGLAALTEKKNERIHTESDVEFYLGVRPLILLPSIDVPANGKNAQNGKVKQGRAQPASSVQ